ncbi:MAG: hypothetical protein AAGJ54_08205 [Planctomycetota bacterium]
MTTPDRDQNGKFVAGNKAARGRRTPGAAARAARDALLTAADTAAIERIGRKLVEMAEAGDVQAARVVLLFVLGPPRDEELQARLDELEALIGELRVGRGEAA